MTPNDYAQKDLRAQSGEDKVALNYFGSFRGRFLDLGAYDGVSCSNTYGLSQVGWTGTLVEGGIAAFRDLTANYGGHEKLQLVHAVMCPTADASPLIEWWENAQEREGGFETGWWAGLGSTTTSFTQHKCCFLFS